MTKNLSETTKEESHLPTIIGASDSLGKYHDTPMEEACTCGGCPVHDTKAVSVDMEKVAEKYGLDNCRACNSREGEAPCTCIALENAFLAGYSHKI